MTHQTAAGHHSGDTSSNLIPIIGGAILAALWGAYTILIVVEIAMLGAP